jgi:hypothetical protein
MIVNLNARSLPAVAFLLLIAQAPSTVKDRVLAVQKVRSGASEQILTLYERELPKPSTAARLRYILYTKPAAGADSNLAFYVRVTSDDDSNSSVAWVIYETAPEFMNPKPIFKAALHAGERTKFTKPWLALTEEMGDETMLKMYEIDYTKQITKTPLSLDPERKEEWPTPSQPRSSISYKDAPRIACNVSNIAFSVSVERALVRAHREPKGCTPLEAVFDSQKGSWSKPDLERDHNP